MDGIIRWGILGPGAIAHKFVKGLKELPGAELTAVGSRSIERAEAFGVAYDIPNRYGSYEDLVNDPLVDVIYIASPHTYHREHTLLCLEAGKAVLCEKPMAINAAEAEEMITIAREKKVFLMEGMWTRFLPIMAKVREWIDSGHIGEIRMLKADFGFRTAYNPDNRLFNPNLGGGALLDVGVYTVALSSMIFKEHPVQITGVSHMGDTGVDEQSAFILGYQKGELALLSCAVRTNTPHEAVIIGTEGSIKIPKFWRADEAILHTRGVEPLCQNIPFVGTGYNYEAAEVMNCLWQGKLESELMPLKESLSILKTMDALRNQWGLKYPME